MSAGEAVIAVEEILAAVIDSYGGRLEIDRESMEKSYDGKVMAIDYDYKKERVVLTLVDGEDIDYEDE